METYTISTAVGGISDAAKMEKKIATAKDQLGKKTVAPRLCNDFPAATVDRRVIIQLEEGEMV